MAESCNCQITVFHITAFATAVHHTIPKPTAIPGGTMIALKLVRLIETHHEQLARSLMRKVEESSKCAELKKRVPHQELEMRYEEVYGHISDWLLNKTEHDIFVTYTALGRHRFEQGVPFEQFLWGIMLVKENLWDFLERESVEVSAMNLQGEFELLRLLGLFFDKALYYAALGYWEAHEFEERERKMAHAV
jgi:hypothetical protein